MIIKEFKKQRIIWKMGHSHCDTSSKERMVNLIKMAKLYIDLNNLFFPTLQLFWHLILVLLSTKVFSVIDLCFAISFFPSSLSFFPSLLPPSFLLLYWMSLYFCLLFFFTKESSIYGKEFLKNFRALLPFHLILYDRERERETFEDIHPTRWILIIQNVDDLLITSETGKQCKGDTLIC